MDDNQVRVVGWLDITEGSIQGGNPLSRPLEALCDDCCKGETSEGDGHHDDKVRRGCWAGKVKEMFTNFKVPKFGVDTHLSIKCGVVVCDGLCPLSPCKDRNGPIKVRDIVVLETETYVRQAEEQKQAAAVASSVDDHGYNPLDKIQVLYTRVSHFAHFSPNMFAPKICQSL